MELLVGSVWGRWRRALLIVALFILLCLYLPLLGLTFFSFNRLENVATWGGFSAYWYLHFFDDEELVRSLAWTIKISGIVSLISVAIGTLAAYRLQVMGPLGLRRSLLILILPLITPDVILAISTASFFSFLEIEKGLLTIVLSDVVFATCFAVIVIGRRFESLGDDLLELIGASRSLGASEYKTFMRVIVPLILPGIVGAFIVSFVVTADDFLITSFNAGPGQTTLTMLVLARLKTRFLPTSIAVISTVILFITICISYVAIRLEKPRRKG